MVDIKTHCCGTVICTGYSHRRAIIDAVRDGVSLEYANLRNLDLDHLNLVGIDLRNADLRGTDFEGSNLTRADISHTLVRGASFEYANLSMANAYGTGLSLAYMFNTITEGILGRDG